MVHTLGEKLFEPLGGDKPPQRFPHAAGARKKKRNAYPPLVQEPDVAPEKKIGHKSENDDAPPSPTSDQHSDKDDGPLRKKHGNLSKTTSI